MPLDLKDTISGSEGRAFMERNGKNIELFELKRLEARMETTKTEGKTIGKRSTQHKKTGWVGTGEIGIHKVTSAFVQMAVDYHKNGKDEYFKITVVNDDPNSTIGKQTVVLGGVNLDEYPIALLDVDEEILEETIPFTFDDVDLLDKFKKPKNL